MAERGLAAGQRQIDGAGRRPIGFRGRDSFVEL